MGQIPMGQIQSFQIFQTLQTRGKFCFEICGLIFFFKCQFSSIHPYTK